MTDDQIARRCFQAKQASGMVLISDVISIVRDSEEELLAKTCEKCDSYEGGMCTDHKGHYCIRNSGMEDRFMPKQN